MHYRISNLIVQCDLALVELPTALPGVAPDVRIEIAAPREQADDSTTWTAVGIDDDEALLLARDGDGYCVRFPESADFHVNAAGTRVRCTPAPEVPDVTLRHLLVDQVLPRVQHLRGDLVFHASSVALDDDVVAFLGPSGMGKSTLAAHFWTEGATLVGDDTLLIADPAGEARAVSAYPGLRLLPADAAFFVEAHDAQTAPMAHYNDKVRLTVPEREPAFAGGPLRRLYVLDESDDIRIERMSPSVAFMALVAQMFRLDIFDADRLRKEAETLSASPIRAAVRSLHYPRSRDQLPAVAARIRADLASDG